MTPRVRFAPSPTGRLHIGNIRTAALNWLFAKKHGGNFLLRLDDTDAARSTEEFADAIRDDLTWLGLTWNEEARQRDRTERYEEQVVRLKSAGVLYPCFETEEELDRRRKRQLAMRRPPIYDRAALKLTLSEVEARIAAGETPHWRFRLPNTEEVTGLVPQPTLVSWNDLIRGDQTVDLGSLSDPVLIRADGTFLYTLTSVIDDIDFAITHIVRGEDHVTNTGVQVALFEALGSDAPAFGHHSLLVGADGQALSKRLGALSIQSFRDANIEPMAVLCHAALVGTSDAIEPLTSRDELAAKLDFSKISTAPGRFDVAELRTLNGKLLHHLDYADVAGHLNELGVGGGEAFWHAVRGNLEVLPDARMWWDIATRDIDPVIEDPNATAAAAAVLPAEPWDESTWSAWTAAVKAATGAKGRALFHPLRLALTAREAGPELKTLLPFIGRERALARLAGRRS
ncbi:glutamate--tRNA ligase [Hyphomicrobium methylovorum]|uniref:glutamate--tRNA ligase n=1 Tax=Hyphomicrobium methylovorum TaxID=84 RepID=UPI0015E74250|nr:glutamate--tRNA ligase [Hyphomicrobium methylovorum]MBA2124859.1 glutamate--tRNA ligase [Hyphomicrobium methylovorum]